MFHGDVNHFISVNQFVCFKYNFCHKFTDFMMKIRNRKLLKKENCVQQNFDLNRKPHGMDSDETCHHLN